MKGITGFQLFVVLLILIAFYFIMDRLLVLIR
jgi:hypothetical protein